MAPSGGMMPKNEGFVIGGAMTSDIMSNPVRGTYGPITLSNGAIYTGELLNGMKDGYGQQVW